MSAQKTREHTRLSTLAGWMVVGLACAVFVAGCTSSNPDKEISKAQAAYQKHDYHAAEVYLKSLLQQHPDNGPAWALLGHTSLARRDYGDAAHQFSKALENGQSKSALAIPLAQAQLELGQYQAALDALKEVKSSASGHDRALAASMRGDAEFGLGQYDKAAASYQSALNLDPDFAPALRGKARLAIRHGNREGARKALSKAVAAHPDDVGSLLLLGQMDYRAMDCSRAAQRLGHAIEVGARSMSAKQQVRARALLADCQLRVGDEKAAQKNVSEILKLSSNDAFGNYLQALVDIRQGNYLDAGNHVQITLNSRPNNLKAMLLMGWIQIAQGRPERAQPFLTRVLDKSPDNVAALRLQTGLWMAEGQKQQAIDLLKKTYQSNPEGSKLHATLTAAIDKLKQSSQPGSEKKGDYGTSLQLDLAGSLAEIGSLAAADTVLSKIKPGTEEGQRAVESMRIRIALAGDNPKEAIKRAEAFAKTNPDDLKAQMLLADVYASDKRYEASENVLDRIRESNPDNVAIARAQARLHVRQGDFKSAISDLLPMHKSRPDDTGLTLALARLYIRAQRPSDAIDLLQSAFAGHPASTRLGQALVSAYLSTRQTDKAMSLITGQLAAKPDDVAWLQLKGAAQMISGHTKAGLKTLGDAADHADNRPDLVARVARIELQHGEVKTAMGRLKELRQSAPDYWPAVMLLAVAQARDGQIDAARKQVSILRKNEQNYAADVLEGNIMRIAGHYRKADAAYASAYESKPSRGLAVVRFETRRDGHLSDPSQPLEQWLTRSPNDAAAMLKLADWYQSKKQVKKAADLYHKVLAIQPESVVALNNLALSIAGDDPKQAITYAKKAHETAPNSPPIADTLGWLLVQNGQLNQGIALLKTASEQSRGSIPEIEFHYGSALVRRGGADDLIHAKKLLTEALASGLPKQQTNVARQILSQLNTNVGAADHAE